MTPEALVAIVVACIALIGNGIMLAFYAGGQKQVIHQLATSQQRHDDKLEQHGKIIEQLKSDVRLIAVESGASKYVQQIP